MTFATGSRSGLSYITEATLGTTPSTPTMQAISFTTHDFTPDKARVQSNDINSDRMSRHDRHGNRQANGNLVVDLRASAYDPFIESAMLNSYSTNVLKTGTTLKSFTFEDSANDIAQFRVFKGMAVNSMAMNIRPNEMVETTFGFQGTEFDDTAQATIANSLTAASTAEPMDAYTGSLSLNSVSSNAVTAIQFSIENNITPAFSVGSVSAQELIYGRSTVEGTLTAYYEDEDISGFFEDETEIPLSVSVRESTNTNGYDILFPRIKVNGAGAPVQNDKERFITIPFVALYDATEGTNIKITRV